MLVGDCACPLGIILTRSGEVQGRPLSAGCGGELTKTPLLLSPPNPDQTKLPLRLRSHAGVATHG